MTIRRLFRFLSLLGCLAAALAAPASAQEHHHGPATGDDDGIWRLVLEGPHLTLAHNGYIVLNEEQVRALQDARQRLCAAEVEWVEARARGSAELAALLADGAEEPRVETALEDLARADVQWMLALVRARSETLARLSGAQQDQLAWLREHWAREARAMIDEATHPGHRGHPGMQLPIRVPGMVVTETSLAPFCEALHGPSVHISIPPPTS